MPITQDYLHRVYAGVLGKIIGVYLGRPFEGTHYRDMLKRFGHLNYYVNEECKSPLILTDDDISGTFTFLRALEDYAHKGKDITAADIGQTWLNYLIEERTVLWWGGLGASTEHTAYLRLKAGIKAPRSGSMELNSQVVAEQIGAQIFIDGWGMVAPGDPALAADLAKKAGSVSHDGESVYAAQVVAAMEAQAFVEKDLNKLIDTGVSFIPADCIIRRMIDDLRDFRAKESDWNKAMTDVMEKKYGYDKYGGLCHVIPNHGLIILGLLYGEDDFQKSLMITNTCGWDTDCNSGNVGCLLGIKNGLGGIDAGADFRGPVADRILMPTADGSNCITDAVRETYRIVNMAHALNGQKPLAPKDGARFHFSLPGSIQGFTVDRAPALRGTCTLSNIGGQLAIQYQRLAPGRVARVSTPTFITPDNLSMPGYALHASPALVPGQKISATLGAAMDNKSTVTARLFVDHYAIKDEPSRIYGPEATFAPGQSHKLEFIAPDCGGQPMFAVGIEIVGEKGATGTLLLDRLSITGDPTLTLGKVPDCGLWRRGWVDGVNAQMSWHGPDYLLIQNRGRGLHLYGGRDWHNYTVSAELTPHLAAAAGLAARVQGLQRFYAVQLVAGKVQLIKVLDGTKVLAEAPFQWKLNNDPHRFSLTVKDNTITATVDDKPLFNVTDTDLPLASGGIALLIEEGRLQSGPVSVKPA